MKNRSGGPGAGKGTVCQKLKDEFGFAHYSAGMVVRMVVTIFAKCFIVLICTINCVICLEE
jgi:dephospho-CoA kinase